MKVDEISGRAEAFFGRV